MRGTLTLNDPVTTARILMCLLAMVPSLAGYYWVQHQDRFPQNSLRKIGMSLLVVFIIFGTVFLQYQVYRVIGHIDKADSFSHILVLTEGLFALVVIFVSSTKRERTKRRQGNHPSSGTRH